MAHRRKEKMINMKQLRVLVGRTSIGARGAVFYAPDEEADRLIADGLVEEIGRNPKPLRKTKVEPMTKDPKLIDERKQELSGE